MTDSDIEALESFSGNKDQVEFIKERLASHYQFDRKQYLVAANKWLEVIDLNGVFLSDALVNITTCYSKLGMSPDAFESIEKALLSTKSAKLKEKMESIKSDMVKNVKGEELDALIEINKLITKGSTEEAIKKCEDLLVKNPLSKSAHFKLASLYGSTNQKGRAKAEFLKA